MTASHHITSETAPQSPLRAFARDDEPIGRADLAAQYRPRSRLLPAFIALVALGSFAAVVWYAYLWGTGQTDSGELPVVRADPAPEKVRPQDPGGLEVLHQDSLILNRPEDGLAAPGDTSAGTPRVERLLPPPETPLPPPRSVEPMEPVEPSVAEPGVDPGESVVPTVVPDAPSATSLETAAGRASAEAPAAEGRAAAEAAVAPVVPVRKPARARRPSDRQAQVAALPSGVAGFDLQLVSLRSTEAARREASRLQRVFAGLLGTHRVTVTAAAVAGQGTLYRLRVGPFAERAGAQALCAQLKAKKQDCFVVRR